MHHIKLALTLITSCLIGLASCEKGFLDRAPETNISDAEFWKSANDLKLYANNWYGSLPNYNDWGSIGIYGLDADQGSDNMIRMGYNTSLNGERTVPASGGGWSWGSVRNVNYFLENYTKSTESFEALRPYVGEAYFFRAWYYFSLLKMFGDLPWINKPLLPTSTELFDSRLPRNIIVDSLMNDLDKAVEYLPSKSRSQASRINKQIAQLFQARIALYEGTWEKYHAGTEFGVGGSNGEKFLQKAATVTDALIAEPDGYGLEMFNPEGDWEYWGLFNRTDYSSSPEIMLWRQYDRTLNGGHRWFSYTVSGAGRGLTKDLIDSYLCMDGKPISTSDLYEGDNTLLDVVANRDPRLSQTIYVDDNEHIVTDNRPGGLPPSLFRVPSFTAAEEARPATGYQVYKGHNPDYNQQQDVGTSGLIIFRFAEALLINAEAKAELGTFTQADADNTINKLRGRVNMPALQIAALPQDLNPEFPALNTLINEVRRERRIELACEGYRFDDLHRWAAMDEKIVDWKPKGAKRAQWNGEVEQSALDAFPVDDEGYIELYRNVPAMSEGYQFDINRDYLAPIPTDQITLNPKITQNPGWD
ncbi:MAG: RagB/SusD family nutrient uptake outer membrane protein [Parapedobacter sp.]|nr:MAG: RagB/SusD family nutrient uptake outer membrane protein [Parapedobacter sp.]